MGGGAVTFGETVHDDWWLFGVVLAPVLIAPFVEEVFFRGLVLRAVAGSVAGSRAVSLGIAIAVSGLVFALVHVLQATTLTNLGGRPRDAWCSGWRHTSRRIHRATGRSGHRAHALNALVVLPALF